MTSVETHNAPARSSVSTCSTRSSSSEARRTVASGIQPTTSIESARVEQAEVHSLGRQTLAGSSTDKDIELCSNDSGRNEDLVDVHPGTRTSGAKWWQISDEQNRKAARFGLRLSFVLTLSSLFVLVQNPDDNNGYPQGTWVYVSALIVSWFPSNQVASVAQKTFQRIIGTLIGACLGIGCGFLSSLFHTFPGQATFIGCCIAVVTFLVAYAMVELKSSLFAKHPYSSLLCLMTFGISVLPFYTDNENEWQVGMWRVINVIIGCAIGALAALFLWPRSNKSELQGKVNEQVKLAGEAADAVLQLACETFAKNRESFTVETESKVALAGVSLLKDIDDVNVAAHQKYSKAIANWKAAQDSFPLAKYDPCNLCRGNEDFESYRKESAVTLSRALRIQTTVVLLDGALRNDAALSCSDEQIQRIREIGSSIKIMLTPTCDIETGDAAAEHLLDYLQEMRESVFQEAAKIAAAAPCERSLFCGSITKTDFKATLCAGKSLPFCIPTQDNCMLLFLQLVEHLVIRCLRLYYSWSQTDAAAHSRHSSRENEDSNHEASRGQATD